MSHLTIFTPTYNRAYILHELYNSLKSQTSKDFEWIIIDDGSSDNTETIVSNWLKENHGFFIRYYKTKNGGKQRAINTAVSLISTEFVFIVDSDDILTNDAVETINIWLESIKGTNIIGVAGLKGFKGSGLPIGGTPKFQDKEYIDATNLDRSKYNLNSDMAEVYKVSILKKFPFPVWHNETFTPENVVWNDIAAHGYKLRWFNKVIYLCDYLDDGLTKGGYKTYYNNLIGCAMALNMEQRFQTSFLKRIKAFIEIDICCCLKHDYHYLKECDHPVIAYALLPAAYLIALHRYDVIRKNLSLKE